MVTYRTLRSVFLFGIALLCNVAFAENNDLLPKYGSGPKNEVQQAADKEFLRTADDYYKGDRKKAAEYMSARGWQFLRQSNHAVAMRRFNQAWLLDSMNGSALWGMAAISSMTGKTQESLKLFAEAEQYVGTDVRFSTDYAMTIGRAGAETKDDALLQDAFGRFARLYAQAPQNTTNLQNWAITLYSIDNYAEAWKKIRLAEATPAHADLDKNFIAALQAKMPRPK
ncbi:MAG: hypothetical protein ABI612_04420 [Betaproteobacteria bacterium]